MATQKATLADALLRRKELEGKVKVLSAIKAQMLVETIVDRVKVTDAIDNVVAKVSKVKPAEVTAEFDHYSRALRLCDSVIQKTNWSTDVELDTHVYAEYVPPQKRDPAAVEVGREAT